MTQDPHSDAPSSAHSDTPSSAPGDAPSSAPGDAPSSTPGDAPSSAPGDAPSSTTPPAAHKVGFPLVSPEVAQAFRRKKWIILILITLVSAAVDQWTKEWAQQDLQFRPGGRVTLVEGYAAFSYVRNPGAAWGFLAKADESFRKPFFMIVNIVAMLFILYIHIRLEPGQYLLLVAISLVLSGAIGNFIDRLKYNYVVDFIKLHLQHRFEWPTFNVADIAITVGVILLFAEMFITPVLRRRAAVAAGVGHSDVPSPSASAPGTEDEDVPGQ